MIGRRRMARSDDARDRCARVPVKNIFLGAVIKKEIRLMIMINYTTRYRIAHVLVMFV